jgi:hypothetical protein
LSISTVLDARESMESHVAPDYSLNLDPETAAYRVDEDPA